MERVHENQVERMLTEAARLLGMPASQAESIVPLRAGVRSRAVLASPAGAVHRLSERATRVVLKLYKGDGRSVGSRAYRDYHGDAFARVPALGASPFVQRSLEAGVSATLGPYAVVQYIEGEELAPLLDARALSPGVSGQVLRDLFEGIWIPLWAAGLRFKDCHPGNFVLTPGGRTVMIDTEQMRKGVEEYTRRPGVWRARDAHEAQGLRRLPRLVQRVALAGDPALRPAPTRRAIDAAIARHALRERLGALGRTQENAASEAVTAVRACLGALVRDGVLR